MRFALICAAALTAAPALAQDIPDSVVFGRQVLMAEMEGQLGPADLAAIGEDFDLGAAQRGASAVSAMLTATPYLFPEGTDADATANDDFPSTALPAIWENFESFRAMANQSSQMAFDLSQISDEAAFRAKAAELRAACNACHAAFMQAYESPF